MAKSVAKRFPAHLSSRLSDYFEEDAFFILAVSGGPDSMALMYLFHQLKAQGLVVHINYGKRGKESDADQELTEQMAFAWGFECCSIRLDPDNAKGENFQNWAREQRYQFFRDLKTEYNADAIVTAHHQDDQVETILQKILRGSSPATWQGMKEWDGELFRPLLSYSKQQILDFCEAEAILYRTDKSNESSEFARNFIRNEFSDQMDQLFPGWQQNILALVDHARTFEDSIHVIAKQVFMKDAISLEKFTGLPDSLKSAVLKNILDHSGLEGQYSKGQLNELSEIEALQTGKSLRIANMELTRDRDQIHLRQTAEVPGISEIISRKQAEKGHSVQALTFTISGHISNEPFLRLDSANLNWPLALRNWASGDAFIPLGMTGSQKVSDHLTNRKIPSISREKALVLCGSDGTIYAIIYPVPAANKERGAISEIAKCTPSTQTFLTINFS